MSSTSSIPETDTVSETASSAASTASDVSSWLADPPVARPPTDANRAAPPPTTASFGEIVLQWLAIGGISYVLAGLPCLVLFSMTRVNPVTVSLSADPHAFLFAASVFVWCLMICYTPLVAKNVRPNHYTTATAVSTTTKAGLPRWARCIAGFADHLHFVVVATVFTVMAAFSLDLVVMVLAMGDDRTDNSLPGIFLVILYHTTMFFVCIVCERDQAARDQTAAKAT